MYEEHTKYFGDPVEYCFNPTLFQWLKFKLFGKRIVECAGPYTAVWYRYKGVLYMVEYGLK